jgi:hypothetical protein
MKKTIAAIFTVICASVVSSGATTFSTYTNETDFFSAIAGKPSFTENWSTVPGWGTRLDTNIITSTNGTDFGFTAIIPGTAPVFSFWGDDFGLTRALSTGDPDLDVFVMTNFSLNTFAVGGYFFPSDGVAVRPDTDITITLLFSDLSSTTVITNRGSTSLADWFFGWVTDEPGTSVESITFTAGTDYASASEITLAVPEPSTYALLGLAAVGLGVYAFRRRRQA